MDLFAQIIKFRTLEKKCRSQTSVESSRVFDFEYNALVASRHVIHGRQLRRSFAFTTSKLPPNANLRPETASILSFDRFKLLSINKH